MMISTDKCVRGHLATRLPEPSPNESRTFELTDIHKPWLLFMSSSFSNIVDYFFLEESLLLIQYIVNVYKWTKNNIKRKSEFRKSRNVLNTNSFLFNLKENDITLKNWVSHWSIHPIGICNKRPQMVFGCTKP